MQGPSPEHLGPGHVGMAGPFPKSLLEFLSPLAACGPHSLPAYPIIAPNHPILPTSSHQSVCGPGALARSHFTLGSELVTTIGASPPLLAEQPLGTMTTPAAGTPSPPLPRWPSDSKSTLSGIHSPLPSGLFAETCSGQPLARGQSKEHNAGLVHPGVCV